jgi:hypothetical protein
LVSFLEGQPEAALFEEMLNDVQDAETGIKMAGVLLNNFEYAFLWNIYSYSANVDCRSQWTADSSEKIPLSFLWILDDRDVSSPVCLKDSI